MAEKSLFAKFYLDREKDIVVRLYKTGVDELTYEVRTPNHGTGNLITNLAKISGEQCKKDENDMKYITGTIRASINVQNEDVYIFRMGKYRVASIYDNGMVQVNGHIPAIIKTLMSQTKNYSFPIEKTIVKSYIFKQLKFRTDLHTHMNANLSPDALISLGLVHQIKYPYYYIKKLNLKLTEKQYEFLENQRKDAKKRFVNCGLEGKKLTRKIDDNTFINFLNLILDNMKDAEENLEKIRKSLVILKDGQAVFTNLEKLYIYRYVFAKGTESTIKENINNYISFIKCIPIEEIRDITMQLLKDKDENKKFKNNTLLQDKLLLIAREFKKQGIYYSEIANTTLTKPGKPAIEFLQEINEILPEIEKLTGVKLRFLVAIRRVPLFIIEDEAAGLDYLRENFNVMRAVSINPYVVGCDFQGEEINDIYELKPIIEKITQFVVNEDKGFTIRIHAGENDSLKDNVENSINCVKESLKEGQVFPKIRIGHGLYTPDLNSKKGKQLIRKIKEANAIMEFQITSNVRLNNLSKISNHPLKQYLKNGVNCVQGTDGCGFYGIDTIDEQLSLINLLGLKNSDLEKMCEVEKNVIEEQKRYFEEKQKKFYELLELDFDTPIEEVNKKMEEKILELEEKYEQENKNSNIKWRVTDKVSSIEAMDKIIKSLPLDKLPIIIAGGSFNARGRHTNVEDWGYSLLENIVNKVDPEKCYFVIGHSIRGYEKAIIEICRNSHKNFEIYSIIPKLISKDVKQKILSSGIDGVTIAIDNDESGIYKSFNYEIFERRSSIVLAFDGNSPVSNLIQEAKNGKGKAKIYVNTEIPVLEEKANSLEGYVKALDKIKLEEEILRENQEIKLISFL